MTIPNELIAELEGLRQRFPEVDFDNQYHLLDEAGWSGYEEGRGAWLFHHVPTDTLLVLEDVHTVMADYEPPVWVLGHPCGLQTVTWDEWFDLKRNLETAQQEISF